MTQTDHVFIDVEQDPTLIKQLFERHQLPIPDHQPGDWVGIDIETSQPVVIPNIDEYLQLTHSPTHSS